MSLLTKRIFSPVLLKNFLNLRESNFNLTQYYTSFSGLRCVKFQKLGHQSISNVKPVREIYFDFKKANTFVARTFDKVFAPHKFKQKHVGFLWYKTLDEVNSDEFFNLLQIPDTFFSWFRVIELHVWMLLFRMNQDGIKLKYVRDGVVEAMWLDMEARAKMLDMYNKKFNKNFLILFEKFKMTLFWYDYGYFEDDSMLATVIWSVFFERECDDPEKLEALVRFVRYQIKHLQSMNTNELEWTEKTGVWMPLKPHFQILT